MLTIWLAAVAGCGGSREARAPGAPVVFISIDTLRADRLPLWGYANGATPAIDALARDGVRFANAYAQVPLTLPSHSSLLTGLLPPDDGIRTNIGFTLDPDRQASLPKALAAAGYRTGAAVSAYVLRGETGLAGLFDVYDDAIDAYESATLGQLQRPGGETLVAAGRFLDAQAKGKPFFYLLHLFEPHSPYEPAEPFRSRFADPYDGEIATADALVGRFLDDLKRRGLYDGSLIVLFSDHGEGLGDHGEKEHGVLLYREAIHVPLIVKLPGARRAGEVIAEPAALFDLFPTVAAIVGATLPPGLPGRSLFALAGEPPRPIYSETLYPRLHLGWHELRSLTDHRHQLIEGPDSELYDVVADPRQTKNLLAERRREYRALADRLAEIPLQLERPQSADPEELARLAALGYLGASAAETGGPRLDPKAHIAILARVQETFALASGGRLREAEALCREILASYPDLLDVRTQQAGILRRLGRFREAVEVYQEVGRRAPQMVPSLAVEIGKIQLDLGDFANAKLHAELALTTSPLEAHTLLSGIALAQNDAATAVAEARLAMGPAAKPRVPALLLLAQGLAAQGQLEEALAASERAAQRVASGEVPVTVTLDDTRGDLLARLGRAAEAESAFRSEIARFPQTLSAYSRLAILLASQRRFGEIAPLLEEMVAKNPTPRAFEAAARTMDDLGNAGYAADFRRRRPAVAGAR